MLNLCDEVVPMYYVCRSGIDRPPPPALKVVMADHGMGRHGGTTLPGRGGAKRALDGQSLSSIGGVQSVGWARCVWYLCDWEMWTNCHRASNSDAIIGSKIVSPFSKTATEPGTRNT